MSRLPRRDRRAARRHPRRGPLEGRARDRLAAGRARRRWTAGRSSTSAPTTTSASPTTRHLIDAARRGDGRARLRPRLGALHLRHAGPPPASSRRGSRRYLGTDDAILFAACFDANGALFEPLLDRRGRDRLGRAQPRLDHRRHPPLQGQALPLRRPATWTSSRPAARGPRRRRPARDGGDRRRVLDGRPLRRPRRDARPLRPLRRGADGGRLPRHRLRGRQGPGHPAPAPASAPTSSPARSARRWAARSAATSRARSRSWTSCASGRAPTSSPTPSPPPWSAPRSPRSTSWRGPRATTAAPASTRNASRWRAGLDGAGLRPPPRRHPIVPVMLHDARRAQAMAAALFERGVYAPASSTPSSPRAAPASARRCRPP